MIVFLLNTDLESDGEREKLQYPSRKEHIDGDRSKRNCIKENID